MGLAIMRQEVKPDREAIEEAMKHPPPIYINQLYGGGIFLVDGFNIIGVDNYNESLIKIRAGSKYSRYYHDSEDNYSINIKDRTFFNARYMGNVFITHDIDKYIVKAMPHDSMHPALYHSIPDNYIDSIVIFISLDNIVETALINQSKQLLKALKISIPEDLEETRETFRPIINEVCNRLKYPDTIPFRVQLVIPNNSIRNVPVDEYRFLERNYLSLTRLLEKKK